MKGFLHGKYLWKAAFMAGHYMDVSESTYFSEGNKSGSSVRQATCEGWIC